VTETLVLWDVDHTLVDVAGLGADAFGLAFQRLFGRECVVRVQMAGRTDRAIAIDVLRRNGVDDPHAHLDALRAAADVALDELAHLVPTRGRALPGAAAALVALRQQPAVQSLLTGNSRRFAEAKIGPFGLAEHLDLDAGAYGWAHTVRADLVGVARAAALARYGTVFADRRTVLVGDTPLDVEAALLTGAGVVAVATGRYTVAELAATGAHVVLDDLANTSAVLDALRVAAAS
jgi:phosphoglycolate phosphatase